MKYITALTIPLALSLAQPAVAAALLTGGHIDAPAFGYDTVGGFEPHFHNEGGSNGAIIDGVRIEDDTEYEPDELIIVVGSLSTTTLGANSYYWLPETETEAANKNVPFLGIGLEELNLAEWTGGTVTISLMGITGPGNFRLWQYSDLGEPIDFINTDVGAMSFTSVPGTHRHYNWGFTELGVYELEFQISGTHVLDGFQSGSATYTFAVPEPSTAPLGALGALALLRRRR